MTLLRTAIHSFSLIACAGWICLAAQSQNVSERGLVAGEPRSDQNVRLGERLYRRGVATNGAALPATVQGDLRVSSTTLPCVNCHRRSGFGSSEGTVTVPSITGPALFNPVTLGNPQLGIRTTGAGTRPAYDDNSLLHALRDGIDPAGRRLSATMPRYAIGDADVLALASYLRSLSAVPPPGVTGTTLHLATITSTARDRSQQDSMLSVLNAFVRSKNAGTRNETKRRERGPWDMKAHYEGYRDWQLHEWTLQGSSSSWRAQLEQYYARQPVFAVVSGLADGEWTPVHEFCEQTRLPCLFPHTAAPAARPIDDGFYSLYFSRGLGLEAATLAHHLNASASGAGRHTILQVLRCGGPASDAARQLVERIDQATTIRTQCVEPSEQLPAAWWRTELASGADVVVSWLGFADFDGFAALASSADGLQHVEQVYFSASLLGDAVRDLPGPLATKAFLLNPFVQPEDFEGHARRALTWAKSQGIDMPDRRVAVNTFFAISLVSDALSIPRAVASREYFIEQIEHMVGRTVQPSAYPAVSLGPRRRFASLGCSVLKIPSEPGASFSKVGQWFVPEFDAKEIP